ncbi:MAG TPA: glycoside hydrolase family 95 protein, partial [Candidatus Sulfotelmatobacter sp.]|nr:glycoside hydrolase family 95 protein [Candidatus Sulfotelmatobacter sp.]
MRLRATVILFFWAAAPLAVSADFRLVYDKPASQWTEALPLGNGRIGAMVFGGTVDERLQINEDTLWGGGPHNYTPADANAHLDEIRRLIFAGKVGEAEKLSETAMGVPKVLMPYQPFCDIRLHFAGHDAAAEYQRVLTLNDAIAETTYQSGATKFRREAFISRPDQVLVVRITASRPGQLSFSVGMDSPQAGTHVEKTAGDTLQLAGQIQPRENPAWSWTGSWKEPGMRFAAVLKVLSEGGSVHAAGDRLEIADANAVTILFSNATSFRNYHDISGDAVGGAQEYVRRAAAESYEQLRRRHVDDFQRLFSRAELRLGEDRSGETTDRRLSRFGETDDPGLLALYFEFGRYLLISSSRPGGQPANLQGIWNQDLIPAWSSKWTTNINLE